MIFSSVDGLTAVDNRKHVLVDGCFDPLHQGHIRYLRTAARVFHGKSLAVVVATDDEIRKKGREPLLSQSARCAVVDGLAGVDVVIAQDRPTHEMISALKPLVYAKGSDWEGKLPPEILAACSLNNTQVLYLDTVLDSSSDRLRQWAAKEDAAHLDRLEKIVASQKPVVAWEPVTDYSFEARKEIEGSHPRLILNTFQPLSILDAGCGPGHLVRLLKELGFSDVEGIDSVDQRGREWFTQGDIADPMLREFIGWNCSWDLVICREVLEHIPLKRIPQAVANLCQLAERFIYVTTRFTKPPAHLLAVDTSDDLDPTHISMLNQDLLRTLFVLNGGKRRKDLETKLDHMGKGRVLCYEV